MCFLSLYLFCFAVGFQKIIEKIAASFNCAKRSQEKGVVTGVQASARRLRGDVLWAIQMVVTMYYMSGPLAERGTHGGQVPATGSSYCSSPRDFPSRLDLGSFLSTGKAKLP